MNTANELVSIIMPSYNTARFIKESIQSVLDQTYQNWELIIVDDCSTDNTDEVVASIKDDRIKYFKNEKNSGAAVSRNRALREAKGKWIAFLDSDDLWLPEKLEKQIEFMRDNNYHFSYTNYIEIDEDDSPNGTFVTGPKKVSKALMYTFNYLGCLTVMYDREYVGLIQIEDLKKRNDYAIWVKVAKKCPAYLLNEDLARYRIRMSGSVMNRSKGPLARMKYNYYLWKDGERLNNCFSLFLTCINFGFGVYKTLRYKKKGLPEYAADNSNQIGDLAMVVVSCDAYMDVVDHFFDLKERFMPWWNLPCYLINNNSQYKRKDVTVINCGNDLNWSGRLRFALEKIPENFILYFQEDYLIGKPVNKEVLINSYLYMRKNGIWYYKIDNLPKIKKKVPGVSYLSYIPSNKRYGINLLTAIFNKHEFLSRIPENDVSAGVVETNFLNSVTDKYEYDIPGCVLDNRQIIDVHYGVRRGKWWPSTVRYFKSIGYEIDTSKRGTNPARKVFCMDFMSVVHHLMPTWMVRKTKKILKNLKISFYSND